MPLLDHFHPPLSVESRWESFRVAWACMLVEDLNLTRLPRSYFAEVMAFPIGQHLAPPDDVLPLCQSWAPPAPDMVMPTIFPDRTEVLVYSEGGGGVPLAAIVLISPENKKTAQQRRAMAARCASYLGMGTHLILMDVVTEPSGNLHNEIMRVLQTDEQFRLPMSMSAYAVAYRSVLREERNAIDIWSASFSVGDELPRLPLEVTEELVVPVDFETTYMEACRRRRLSAR